MRSSGWKTGADVGDCLAADGLIQGDEAAVFMDKAYDSAARREALAEAGIVDGIMNRGHAWRPRASRQRWMNTTLAPRRLSRPLAQWRPPAPAL